MRMAFLIVFLLAVLGALGGVLYLGLHPPRAVSHTVTRTLDNDKLPAH